MARMSADRSHIGPEAYSDETMLPSLEELAGMDVCDVAGERIGTVEDAYTDTEGGYVRYLGVKTGWLGTRRHVIPVDDVHMEFDGDDEPFLSVPYERDQMREGRGRRPDPRRRAADLRPLRPRRLLGRRPGASDAAGPHAGDRQGRGAGRHRPRRRPQHRGREALGRLSPRPA